MTNTTRSSIEEGCNLSIGIIIVVQLQVFLSWTALQASGVGGGDYDMQGFKQEKLDSIFRYTLSYV
jgi:hypothetical protein